MDQKCLVRYLYKMHGHSGPCARSGQKKKNLGIITKLHLEIQQFICISLGCQTIQAYFINSVYQPCLELFLELAPPYRQCSHLKGKTTCPGLTIECQMEPHHFLSYPFTMSILPLHFRLCTLLFSLSAFFLYLLSPLKSFFIGIIFMLKAICSTLSEWRN